jgi:hypothetical protein
MSNHWLKRPIHQKDWVFAWGQELDAVEDTIVAAEVTVAAAYPGQETTVGKYGEEVEFDGDNVTVWLSGGAAGQTAELTCVITTAGGRVLSAVKRLSVVE